MILATWRPWIYFIRVERNKILSEVDLRMGKDKLEKMGMETFFFEVLLLKRGAEKWQ